MAGLVENVRDSAEKARDLVSRGVSSLPAQLRLMTLSAAVGVVAGFGAILFDVLLGFFLDWVLKGLTGYAEPSAAAASATFHGIGSGRSMWFFVIPALGGLLSGAIVFRFAPEAEGHGTDAMIEAFHHKGGRIRKRVPLVKIIASALTIGSGGSAGKEGPIAQIGSGFGSAFASFLKLSPGERRILVIAGAAGGIGAIFQAPLGAALFAPEVLYRETEFEYEAILPSIVSSIFAYAVYTHLYRSGPLFFPGVVEFSIPGEILPYCLFGVLCAMAGFLYIRMFYAARDRFFNPLRIDRMLKPAVGGVMLGAIAYFFPQVSGGGYGWVQMAMDGKLLWWLMLLLAALKIVATSCTISSGGSGGVFGPSVFIGGMLGGAFGFLGHEIAPAWVIHPNSFVLVGIGGFFAGVAKVPIASIIMACEMSASYTLLVPLMLVSSISLLLLRGVSLYEKQQVSRIASPTHISEFTRGMLGQFRVHDAVRPRPVPRIPEAMPLDELVKTVSRTKDSHFAVVSRDGTLTGIVSVDDVRPVLPEAAADQGVTARDLARPNAIRAFWNDTLRQALDKMASLGADELPVAHEESPDDIVAMISKGDIVDFYYGRDRL